MASHTPTQRHHLRVIGYMTPERRKDLPHCGNCAHQSLTLTGRYCRQAGAAQVRKFSVGQRWAADMPATTRAHQPATTMEAR